MYRTQKNARIISAFWDKKLEKSPFFDVLKEDATQAEIFIYDYIGWPFNEAIEFIRKIDESHGKELTIRINSPGGDVFDGVAIYNALESHGNVIIRVDSLAASIASVIAMAGSRKIEVYKSSMLMIHEPYQCVCGNQHEMLEAASVLGVLNENLISIYEKKMKKSKSVLRDLMCSETWITAQELCDMGCAEKIVDYESEKKQENYYDFYKKNHTKDIDFIRNLNELTKKIRR